MLEALELAQRCGMRVPAVPMWEVEGSLPKSSAKKKMIDGLKPSGGVEAATDVGMARARVRARAVILALSDSGSGAPCSAHGRNSAVLHLESYFAQIPKRFGTGCWCGPLDLWLIPNKLLSIYIDTG